MKRIPLHIPFLLVSLLFSAASFAKCAGAYLSVWPAPGKINQNPIFVLDGYAASMDVIYNLNKKYAVYLKSGNTKIKLEIRETLTGQYRIAQAILVPTENLQIGKEYELIIDDLPENEGVRMYDYTNNKKLAIKWKVVAGIDKEAPQWTVQPKYTGKSKMAFGCGPGIDVSFSYAANDSLSNHLIKATVKDVATGKTATYYIPASQNKITVGHGMCSGAFDLIDDKAYEVEFSLMDASGNTSQWPTCWIGFTAPSFNSGQPK
jgi:lipoprotein-anchoring transpeptidase ErfK/SrfK